MKAKVKKVKIPLTGKDEGISEMFNQMLGAGSVNLTISYPKYVKMRGLCTNIVKIFTLLAECPWMKASLEFASEREQIREFCKRATVEIGENFAIDLTEYEWNLNTVDDEIKKRFGESYEAAKKSHIINTFIITLDRLAPYKVNFNNLEALNPKFLTCMACAEWTPFQFTSLNLKQVFMTADENTVRFLMTVLYKIFEMTHKLWQETTSPDVDVEQFVQVIMGNMDEIQSKAPELSRCKRAFKKIADSVSLLKDRFGEYYRDFVDTKDSTIMMQNFIIDVSKSTSADPETMREFREIIKYYKKIAGQQQQNPKMKMLFDKVSDSFKQLEKGTNNLVNIRKEGAAETDTPVNNDNDNNATISAKTMTAEDVEKTDADK
jgi:hypothetical protein